MATRMLGRYRLPHPIAMQPGCSDMSVSAAFGAFAGSLTLPRLTWDGESPGVAAPSAYESLPDVAKRRLAESRTPGSPSWGRVTNHRVTGEVERWWVHAVLLDDDATAEQFSYLPGNRSGETGTPTGPFVDSALDSVDPWFERVAQWIEVRSDHDMGIHGGLGRSHVRGRGLTLVTVEDARVSLPAESRTLLVAGSTTRPLSPEVWRSVVTCASRGEDPTDEQLLLADARAALRRQQFRRAVIDAGTAVEVVIQRRVHVLLEGEDQWIGKALNFNTRSLGWLVDKVGEPLGLPADVRKKLVEPRNDAVHRNISPERGRAEEAVRMAETTVGGLTSYS